MGNTQDIDADIVAVRALLADTGALENAPKPSEQRRAKPDQVQADVPDASRSAAINARKLRPRRQLVLKPLLMGLFHRIRRYRPKSKSILWTSLILMLLLRPVLVFGTFLLCAVFLLGAYLIMGSDRFWRQILVTLAAFSRWFPQPARRIRVGWRSVARSWDRFLDRMPGRWADGIRAPDLSQIARADKLHAEAMADRLSRLRDDGLN